MEVSMEEYRASEENFLERSRIKESHTVKENK
jgi:hypothetical protein